MNLETLTTRYDPAETEITVSVVLDEPDTTGMELKGRFVGPCTPLAETVEVAYPLRMSGTEEGLLRARVILPDPCVWSPAAPFLYRGTVELWQHGQLRAQALTQHGIKELSLRRKGLRLNGESLLLSCLQLRHSATDKLPAYREHGINALLAPVTTDAKDWWMQAEQWGYFLLGRIDPADEPSMWFAQDELLDQTALLAWVLPQSLLTQPQQWHQAMSLLHGQRKDIFIGVQLEKNLPDVLPGHVDFLLGDEEQLLEASAEQTAKLLLLPRGKSQPDSSPSRTIGWVRRDLPAA